MLLTAVELAEVVVFVRSPVAVVPRHRVHVQLFILVVINKEVVPVHGVHDELVLQMPVVIQLEIKFCFNRIRVLYRYACFIKQLHALPTLNTYLS